MLYLDYQRTINVLKVIIKFVVTCYQWTISCNQQHSMSFFGGSMLVSNTYEKIFGSKLVGLIFDPISDLTARLVASIQDIPPQQQAHQIATHFTEPCIYASNIPYSHANFTW